jgi:TonB family protein
MYDFAHRERNVMRRTVCLFALAISMPAYSLTPGAAQNTKSNPGQTSSAPASPPQTKPKTKDKSTTEVIELPPRKSVLVVEKTIVVTGIRPGPSTKPTESIEILSDTMGVDFGPYLKRLRLIVQNHWDALVPESALPPLMKSGTVTIEFAIQKNGGVTGMKLVTSSGDVALDRAAWGGIIDSVPLPTLPGEFKGDYLRLRCNFVYNPVPKQLPANEEPKK